MWTVSNSGARNRILYIQWSGNYRDAYLNFASGGPATYYAQKYSIDQIADLVDTNEQTGVLCCCGDEPHDEMLSNGVRSMCAGVALTTKDYLPIIRQIEAFRPTHLILGTPAARLFEWALAHNIDTMGQFADSFAMSPRQSSLVRKLARSVRHHLRLRRLVRSLNDRRVRCVSNHHIGSSQDLVRIGVDPRKVVPWHWPPMARPETNQPKYGPREGTPWQLLFVGMVIETKGIGDAIEAVAILHGRGRDVQLRVVGVGEIERFAGLAKERGLADRVTFEGRQGHDRVIELMTASHLVLVLSHHMYPEGMPMVIQEALSTRTPLIGSDHPMFRDRISVEATQTVPENRPDAVADAVERILSDPDLYHRMSLETQANWEQLQAPPLWHEIFNRWLVRSPENDRWLAEHSMASRAFGLQIHG